MADFSPIRTVSIVVWVVLLAWKEFMCPVPVFARDKVQTVRPGLQIRFADSATGYSIQPENITARPHRAGADEVRFDALRSSHPENALMDLKPGRYTISVNSSQYQPMTAEIEVRDDNRYRFQFMLDPLEEPRELQSDYIEALHRDGVALIQGFVVDAHRGQPLPGVHVKSLPSGTKTVTDTRGFFQFYIPAENYDAENDAPPAPSSLILEKPGYRTHERLHLEVWSRGDWTYTLRLEPGGGTEIVDERELRRRPAYEGGELRDEPSPKASVQRLTSNLQHPVGEPLGSNAELLTISALASPESVVPSTGTLAGTVASNATVRVPRNIRVERKGVIYYVTMNYYAKRVLPSEWLYTWHTNSLNAGAVVIRSEAIYNIHTTGTNANYDICGSPTCQVFNPDQTAGSANRAVDYTENYVMITAAGAIAETEYSHENNSPTKGCGDGFTTPYDGCVYDPICIGETRSGHGRGMCQKGSDRWAKGVRGYPAQDWTWILQHYFPKFRLVKGSPLVVGDDVRSRSRNCNVRACPGDGIEEGINCPLITIKQVGETGIIIGEPIRVMADGKGFTWYPIRWNDANSTTGWSCENYIVRVVPIPTAPTGLTATAVSTNQINLTWTDTSDIEDRFEIERAPSAAGPWIHIGTVNANVTSFSDGLLYPASTWYYRVQARNAGGASGFTSAAAATTPGAVAPNLTTIPNRTISPGTLFTFAASATAPERVQLITDFEPFVSDTLNGEVLFRVPTNSISTRHFINSAEMAGTNNLTTVTASYPISGHASKHVFRLTCEFTNASNPWLRLTTDGVATLPSPVIDFNKKLRFNIRANRDIRVAIGCRETSTASGTAIGSNGGTSGAIEWVGVDNIVGGAPVPTRSISSNSWTSLTFDFANESVRSFSGGNGTLSTLSGLGVLEHLALVPMDGLGVYTVFLDNLVVVGSPKLTYSLGANAPTGASINPTNGVFTWNPNQSQSPSTNFIPVIVTDDSLPPLSATNIFSVVVRDNVPNSPPMLSPIANHTINAGSTVTFTNGAYDPNPTDTLTFSLDPGAPSGATIQPATGVFTWTPGDSFVNTTQSITVRVTDNGAPSLSGTTSFDVTVLPRNNPPFIAPVSNRAVHIGSSIVFTNLAYDFNTGDVLTFSLDPGAPADASINVTSGVFAWTPGESAANSVNAITVRVTDNGYPPLSGSTTFNVSVGARLEMEGISLSGNMITLTWNALVGVTYRIEYKSNLSDANWTTLGQVTPSDMAGTFSEEMPQNNPQRYYRVVIVE